MSDCVTSFREIRCNNIPEEEGRLKSCLGVEEGVEDVVVDEVAVAEELVFATAGTFLSYKKSLAKSRPPTKALGE